MGMTEKYAEYLMDNRMARAAQGDWEACYDLGVAYSTGISGMNIDLVQAHKWFNLAAVGGDERAQACRAEISGEMTPREISVAQREARAWLQLTSRRAA